MHNTLNLICYQVTGVGLKNLTLQQQLSQKIKQAMNDVKLIKIYLLQDVQAGPNSRNLTM